MLARLHPISYALLAAWLTLACVSKPSLEEVRDRGLHSPAQTLQAFSIALRADWPQEEYTCFSAEFKAKNGLSRLGYLEFRDRLLQEQPLMRYALTKATKNPACYDVEVDPTGRRARIRVQVAGKTLHVLLSRESYYEIYGAPTQPLGQPELWQDDLIDDLIASQMLYEDEGREQLAAIMPHPGRDLQKLAYLRMGHEWKIDDLFLSEEEPAQP